MKCPTCNKNDAIIHPIYGPTICDMCKVGPQGGKQSRRRSLTEWESLKLSFYRSEKKWEDHIRSRQIIEKDGKKLVVSHGRLVPQQPKEYLPPPKPRQMAFQHYRTHI